MFFTSISYIYAQAHGRAVLQWWSTFTHVRGAEGEPHRLGSGKGWQPCKILPGEKRPGPAMTRTWASSDTPCISLWERPLAEGSNWLRSGTEGAVYRGSTSECRAITMSACMLGRQSMYDVRASVHTGVQSIAQCSCKTARLPGWARRAEEQMSSSWDISDLQWSVGQQPQNSRSSHLEKLLQGIGTCWAFFFSTVN